MEELAVINGQKELKNLCANVARGRTAMNSYVFGLLYEVTSAESMENFAESIFSQVGDDAMPGVADEGLIFVEFDRRCVSAMDAVNSAVSEIQNAIEDATFVNASHDYVGITDIANYLGKSRQYIRRLWEDHKSKGFPRPVHAQGKTPVWHLAQVLDYLVESEVLVRDKIKILHETAIATMQKNVERQIDDLDSVTIASGGGSPLASLIYRSRASRTIMASDEITSSIAPINPHALDIHIGPLH